MATQQRAAREAAAQSRGMRNMLLLVVLTLVEYLAAVEVQSSTLLVLVDDTSEGKADTGAFLDRRIEGVMRFEKAKARLFRPQEDSFSMMRLLGRLRYPAR